MRETRPLPANTSLLQRTIVNYIQPGSRVLDLGCGDGEVLELVQECRASRGVGVDISEEHVKNCLRKGLSAIHENIDHALGEYAESSFDYVLLINSLQETMTPDAVIQDMLRVGKTAIISFPNVAHVSIRAGYLFQGKTAMNPELPYDWYETPNIHTCSILDFEHYCERRHIRVEAAHFMSGEKEIHRFANLRARSAVFVLRRQ